MLTDKEFTSYSDGVFKPYFEKFILYKRSKGEKVTHSALSRIKTLNNILNSRSTLEVTKEMVEKILAPSPDISQVTRYAHITHLRQFLEFLELSGVACYQVPYRYTRSIKCEFRPYIFTDAEIGRLLNVVDNLRRWEHRERHTEIYPIVIRLLIGTGMRVSEVLVLRRSHIDCDNGVIEAINSKNGVSRYIPMSESVKEAVVNHAASLKTDDLLFQSGKSGGIYAIRTIQAMFRKFCTKAEIFRPDGTTPNIHSLRHTFCSKSLDQLLATGMDKNTAMPILAAYVGHVNFRDTESYIHFTEQGRTDYVERQKPLRKIIPEVN